MKKRIYSSLMILVVLIFIPSCAKKTSFPEMLISYCKENQEVSFPDVTDFEWDVAYVDRQTYGQGEDIQIKYNVRGDFECLESDYLFRIAFFKDEELVNDTFLNMNNLDLDTAIEIIKPNMVFEIEWDTNDGEKCLYLTLKE